MKAALSERSRGKCEVVASVLCTGRGQDPHHRKTRSHGGGNELTNLYAVCRPCHDFIHRNPAISYEKGWLVHSWDTP